MLSLDRQNEYRRRYAAAHPQWQPSGDLFERLARESLSSSARLLDLGGGRGGLLEKIHNNVSRAAIALDPDLTSLREHRLPSLARLCAFADDAPLAPGSFDLILSTWLLEHLTDPQKVFDEASRLLVPNGRFVFLTPNALHPLLVANRLSQLTPSLQRRLVPRLYGRAEADTFAVHYRANTPHTLQTLCARAGLSLTLYPIADPTYTAFNDFLFNISAWLEALIPTGLKIHLVGVAVKRT